MKFSRRIINFLQGGASTLIASLFSKVFIFVINILIARQSSASDYGEFSLIRSAVISIETVISSALSPLFIKKLSESKKNDISPTIFLLSIFISLWGAGIGYLCAVFSKTASELTTSPNIFWLFILFFLLLSTLLNCILLANRLFSAMAFSNIIALIASFSLYYSIFGWDFSHNAEKIILIFYFTDAAVKIIALSSNNVLNSKSFTQIKINLKSFSFGSPSKLLIASVANTSIFFIVRYDLGVNHGMEELASFDVANQYLMIMILVQNSFSTALLSTHTTYSEDRDKPLKFYKTSSIYLVAFALLSSLVLAALAPLSPLIFGSQYSIQPIYGVAVTIPCFTLALLLNRYMIATGREFNVTLAALIPGAALYTATYYFEPNASELSYAIAGYYLTSIFVYVICIFGFKK